MKKNIKEKNNNNKEEDKTIVNPDSFPDFAYRVPKMNKFSLEEFDKMLTYNTTITGIGKRRSGKTQWFKWLFLKGKLRLEMPWGYVFTHTKLNKEYQQFIPDNYIISDFDNASLERILKRQSHALDLYLKDQRYNPRMFVIWDDYNGHEITYNQALKDYYMTGRHYHTLNFFFIQHKNQLPPAVRDNTDWLVIWNCDNLNNIEQYWTEFAGKMTKECFFQMFMEYTEKVPHGFILIDTNIEKNYNEKFYYGVAELVECGPDTIVGSAEYWRKNIPQLKKIMDGSMKREYKTLQELSSKSFSDTNKTESKTINPKLIRESQAVVPSSNTKKH